MLVDQTGKIGVVEDIPGFRLPLEAWTTANNIRFNDGFAEKTKGYSSFVTPSVAPYFLLPLQDTSVFYWIYAGLTKVYTTDGTNSYDISNGTYQVTADNGWTGDIFNGIPILNSYTGIPQALFPVYHTNSLVDLPNWPANTYCSVMKGFGNYLVALDITEDSQRYPYKVKWSHPADPGSVPVSWDITDTTKDAGERNLSDKGGYLVDGGQIGDSFIIYRENSTNTMRNIGGRFIFSTLKAFGKSGLFAKRCFVEFEDDTGPKHCALTDDDLIVHDGRSKTSVLDGRNRDTLFAALSGATNATRAFLSHNLKKNEIWVNYPTSSDSFPTKALIWNYKHNTVSYIDLPGTMDIGFDVVSAPSVTTISADTRTINTATELIETRLYNPSKRDMLICDTANTDLLKGDDTNQHAGTSFTATLQKTDILIDNDVTNEHTVTRIYPLMSGTGPVNIRLGSQSVPGGSVTWESAQAFTPGTDYKLDVRTTGRLLAVEFETTGNTDWKLHAYDIKQRETSRR